MSINHGGSVEDGTFGNNVPQRNSHFRRRNFVRVCEDERSRILRSLKRGYEMAQKKRKTCGVTQELTVVLLKLTQMKGRLDRLEQVGNDKHTTLGKMISIVRNEICDLLRRSDIGMEEVRLIVNRSKDIEDLLGREEVACGMKSSMDTELGPDLTESSCRVMVTEQNCCVLTDPHCSVYSATDSAPSINDRIEGLEDLNCVMYKSARTSSTRLKQNISKGKSKKQYVKRNEDVKMTLDVMLRKHLPNDKLRSPPIEQRNLVINFAGDFIKRRKSSLSDDTKSLIHESANVIGQLGSMKTLNKKGFNVHKYSRSVRNTIIGATKRRIFDDDYSGKSIPEMAHKGTSYDDFVLDERFSWGNPIAQIHPKKFRIDRKTWRYVESEDRLENWIRSRETNTPGVRYPTRDVACQTDDIYSDSTHHVCFVKVYYSSTCFDCIFPKGWRLPEFPEGASIIDRFESGGSCTFVTCRADPKRGVTHFVLVQHDGSGDSDSVLSAASLMRLAKVKNLWIEKLRQLCSNKCLNAAGDAKTDK